MAKWQTHGTQNPAVATLCRFESDLRHQPTRNSALCAPRYGWHGHLFKRLILIENCKRRLSSEALCEGRTSLFMHYVYLIRSINYPEQVYIGNTVNIKQRLETHNSGGSPHTKQYRPWKIVLLLVFEDKLKATAFEKYLKSGSGNAFAKKRLW